MSDVGAHTAEFRELSLDFVVDSVIDSWYGWEKRWFEHLAIVGKFEDIASKEANFRCAYQRAAEEDLLERMRQRQVADISVIVVYVESSIL